jgi:hypothetical protein
MFKSEGLSHTFGYMQDAGAVCIVRPGIDSRSRCDVVMMLVQVFFGGMVTVCSSVHS